MCVEFAGDAWAVRAVLHNINTLLFVPLFERSTLLVLESRRLAFFLSYWF